jgi:hypothetical protein
MSPFEADLGYIPRMLLDAMATTRIRRSARGHPEINFSTRILDILKELKTSLAYSQEQQILDTNHKREPHSFQAGDMVFLSTKSLPLTYANEYQSLQDQGHRKALQYRYIREFQLGKQRGDNGFEVLLPSHWQLARTFNVSEEKQRMEKIEGEDPFFVLLDKEVNREEYEKWENEEME